MTSTTESAVETLRLAVAIADGFTDGNEPFGEANDAQQRRYLAAARAVIAVHPAPPAASEVTDEMVGAALDAFSGQGERRIILDSRPVMSFQGSRRRMRDALEAALAKRGGQTP